MDSVHSANLSGTAYPISDIDNVLLKSGSASQSLINLSSFEYYDNDKIDLISKELTLLIKEGISDFNVEQLQDLKKTLDLLIEKLQTIENIDLTSVKKLIENLFRCILIVNDAPEMSVFNAFHSNVVQECITIIAKGLLQKNVIIGDDVIHEYCNNIFKICPDDNRFFFRHCWTYPSGYPGTENCKTYTLVHKITNQHYTKRIVVYDQIAAKKGENCWFIGCHAAANEPAKIVKSEKLASTTLLSFLNKWKTFFPGEGVGPLSGELPETELVTIYGSNSPFDVQKRIRKEDELLSALEDSISLQLFVDPTIAKDGNTYSKPELLNVLKNSNKLPLSRISFQLHDLMANPLVSRVIQIRKAQIVNLLHSQASFSDWREDPILRILIDPITKDLLKDPVMAPDGQTYSKKSLMDYLNKHDNFLPESNIKCIEDSLVRNLIISSIIDIRTKYLEKKNSKLELEIDC